ncbi:arsenical efflux pump membrane protein ArsB [Cuniculiplasma sp. SKW4]|uniref:arsenical efflux pump membrane protein ArsB n=1 Tax=Cuniculiplasma sp. SKW4 TaxID=3400171 RepID=UPI003FCFE9EF
MYGNLQIQTINFIASISIFIFSMLLVIRKPKNIGIGYSALLGAALTLVTGLTSLMDVIRVISIVWNATLTFVSVVIISLVFDEAGVFQYLSVRLLKLSRGSGIKLFIFITLGGAFISAVFANDGTALVMTPIIISLLYRAGLKGKTLLAYIMAIGFIADSASIPLLVSNLVNIIAATYFGINFFPYMYTMMVPDLVSVGSSLLFLYLFFRKDIPKSVKDQVEFDTNEIKDPTIFRLFFPVIVTLIISYSVGGYFSIPVALISMPAAAILLIIAKNGKRISYVKPVKEAPWQIIFFSIGMYIVVFAMANAGLTSIVSDVLLRIWKYPFGLNYILTGYLFAFTASIMNNLPSVLLGDLALQHAKLTGNILLTNAIGNDIGPKFTPIGSLATLVWLYMIEKKGDFKISTWDYMKTGIIVGMPVLTLTLFSLYAISPYM